MTPQFPESFSKTGTVEASTQMMIFREQAHHLGTGDFEQKGTLRSELLTFGIPLLL